MVFYAKEIMETYQRVVLHTPDTDVFLIALGMSGDIGGEIYIKTGVQNKTRIMSLNEIKKNLPSNLPYDTIDRNVIAKALLGLHGFTGCDTKGQSKTIAIDVEKPIIYNIFCLFWYST